MTSNQVTMKRLHSLERKFIYEILQLSKEEHNEDTTIICNNGTFKSNSLVLAAIFPVFRNVLDSLVHIDEPPLISMPDVDKNELERVFQFLHYPEEELVFSTMENIFRLLEYPSENIEFIDTMTVTQKLEKIDEETVVLSNSIKEETLKEADFELEDMDYSLLDPIIDSNDNKHNQVSICKSKFEITDDKTQGVIKFKSDGVARRHRKETQNEVSCPECDKIFSGSKALKALRNHKRSHTQKRIICENCSLEFSEWSMPKHLITCLKPKVKTEPKKCPHCNYSTIYSTNFRKHLRKHREKVSCHICGKKVRYDQIQFHTKNHERYTKCPKCDKEILKESLETHECKYIKLDGEKIFKCKECDYSTKHHTNLKRHIDSRHRHVGIPSVPCQFCGKLFSTNSVGKHIKTIHHCPEGHTKCTKCYKNIPNEMFSSHECEKFVCNICGKITTSEKNLRSHHDKVHEHHEISYFCNVCGKGFEREDILRGHMKTHEEKTPCPHCGKLVRGLETHIQRTHTKDGLKKYHCHDCDKGFVDLFSFEKHKMSVHLKLQPFRCRYGCDFGYNDRSNRNAHEKKKHGKLFTNGHEERKQRNRKENSKKSYIDNDQKFEGGFTMDCSN